MVLQLNQNQVDQIVNGEKVVVRYDPATSRVFVLVDDLLADYNGDRITVLVFPLEEITPDAPFDSVATSVTVVSSEVESVNGLLRMLMPKSRVTEAPAHLFDGEDDVWIEGAPGKFLVSHTYFDRLAGEELPNYAQEFGVDYDFIVRNYGVVRG